jgi:hypothetical protein
MAGWPLKVLTNQPVERNYFNYDKPAWGVKWLRHAGLRKISTAFNKNARPQNAGYATGRKTAFL